MDKHGFKFLNTWSIFPTYQSVNLIHHHLLKSKDLRLEFKGQDLQPPKEIEINMTECDLIQIFIECSL